MASQRSWRDNAVNVAEFDAWDRATRQRLGLLAGLTLMSKNNTGGYQVVSRHWPHKLCWDWTLGWHPHRPGYDDGCRRVFFRWSHDYRVGELGIWFGTIRLAWQDYGYMARSGSYAQEAPKIVWQREIDEAVADRANVSLLN